MGAHPSPLGANGGESPHSSAEALRLNDPRPGQTPSSPPPAQPPSWKVLLALLSLSLSALLWFEGLSSSLHRPSVNGDLDLHQLELASLVADAIPESLAPVLLGEAPRTRLAEQLAGQINKVDTPAPALQRLELALLQRSSGSGTSDEALRALIPMVDAPRRPLLEALLQGDRVDPQEQRALLAPWKASTLVQQLSCEQLGGPNQACPLARQRSLLVMRLIGVSVLPAVLLVSGVALLGREVWLLLRGRLPSPPPLVGPPLGLVDTSLLIAGGFVLIGEVLLPQLLLPPLQASLGTGIGSESLAQGLQVLLLYGALTIVPLLMLWRMLRGAGLAPAEGWLQWGWRPVGSLVSQALLMLVLVLPVVALSGWLIERIWPDPGGSNPMLELVLQGSDPLALACFATTALLVAPLFEETLFRGVLLPVLGPWLGGMGAVLLSAALFAAAHLSLGELIPLFVLGTGLGLLRLRTGRLAASVVMHALWNGLTFLNLLLLGG